MTGISEPRYVTRFDTTVFWQFLAGVRDEAPLVELVQNDLDASASKTTVRLEKDRLLCVGDGDCVSDAGWKRLQMVLGAGVDIESKRGGIGVKNYGIRSHFRLGDTILAGSGGKRTQLTILSRGLDEPPYPGVWEGPLQDPSTIGKPGTLIEVPFRLQPLSVEMGKGGEPFLLPAWDNDRRERLYEGFVADIPGKFFGAVRPGLASTYTLEIHLPEKKRWTRAQFRASGPLALPRGLGGKKAAIRFRRRCYIESESSARCSYAEEGLFVRLKTSTPFEARQYRAYRFGRDVGVEVSWPINTNGTPMPGTGVRRYPISMPLGSQASNTGLGFHFSGPYHLALDRSALASGVRHVNDKIDEECLKWAARILKFLLVPQFGPKALKLIRPKDRSTLREKNGQRPVGELIDELARIGGLPAEPRGKGRGKRRSKSSLKRSYQTIPALEARDSDESLFLIPTWSWKGKRAEGVLYPIAPRRYPLIHRRTPPFVVEHLHANHIEGEGLSGLNRFDEEDVIDRLGIDLPSYYPWSSTQRARRRLSNPQIFGDHLRAIDHFLAEGPPEEIKKRAANFDELRESGVLLTRDKELEPWNSVYFYEDGIPRVPGLETPHLLHPDLVRYRCLKKGKPLEVVRFDVDRYLQNVLKENPDGPPKSKCPEFFAWMRCNMSRVRPSTLRALREWPIWPTKNAEYVEFDTLCKPSPSIERILSSALQVPSKALLRLPKVRTKGRGPLRIRTLPSEEEIRSWYQERQKSISLVVGERATKSQERKLDDFEKSLEVLARNKPIRRILKEVCEHHMTLARDGVARSLKGLVLSTDLVKRCQIRKRWIPKWNRRGLYRLLGANQRPTVHALVDAMQTFPRKSISEDAFRLEQLRKACKINPDVDLSNTRLLPVDGELLCPTDIALGISSKKYWGKWKRYVPTGNLSPRLWSFLGELGCVTKVDRVSVSEFLDWLVDKGNPSPRTKAHVLRIVRLIADDKLDPRAFVGKPTIPLEDGTLAPINKATARGKVLINNFSELAREVRIKSGGAWRFVVTQPKGAGRPISLKLVRYGVPDLRRKAGKPVAVEATGNPTPADDLNRFLDLIKQEKMRRELFPRLEQVGTSYDAIRKDWHKIVSSIEEVNLADEVRAVYQLGRQQYPIERDAVVDGGILWVKRGAPYPRLSFFESLIEVIGKDNAPPYLPSGMLTALTRDFQFSPIEIVEDYLDEEAEDFPEEEYEETDESGATHPPVRPDIQPSTTTPPQPSGDEGKDVPPPARPSRPTTKYEKKLILWLKRDQYAYHCQACLAGADPARLAPVGSYSHRLENRQQSIIAHHVRHRSAKGPGRAWNFLVLCTYHHLELGDRLTPQLVIDALDGTKPAIRSWKGRKIQGRILSVSVPELTDPVRLFFREEHLRELQKKA